MVRAVKPRFIVRYGNLYHLLISLWEYTRIVTEMPLFRMLYVLVLTDLCSFKTYITATERTSTM